MRNDINYAYACSGIHMHIQDRAEIVPGSTSPRFSPPGVERSAAHRDGSSLQWEKELPLKWFSSQQHTKSCRQMNMLGLMATKLLQHEMISRPTTPDQAVAGSFFTVQIQSGGDARRSRGHFDKFRSSTYAHAQLWVINNFWIWYVYVYTKYSFHDRGRGYISAIELMIAWIKFILMIAEWSVICQFLFIKVVVLQLSFGWSSSFPSWPAEL